MGVISTMALQRKTPGWLYSAHVKHSWRVYKCLGVNDDFDGTTQSQLVGQAAAGQTISFFPYYAEALLFSITEELGYTC